MIVADRVSSIRSSVARLVALGLIALVVLIGAQLFVNPLFTMRLQSESDDSWLQAAIRPVSASVTAAKSSSGARGGLWVE